MEKCFKKIILGSNNAPQEGSAREIMDMIYAILFVLMGVITLTIVLFCVCVICR